MKKIIIFTIICMVITGCFGSSKPSKGAIESANNKAKPYIEALAKLEKISYDSLYRTTPYKEWYKIDSIAFGIWCSGTDGSGCNSWEYNTKLGDIKENIDKIAHRLFYKKYDYNGYHEYYDDLTAYDKIKKYSYAAEELNKRVVKIRTEVLKTKNRKAYNKQIREDKKHREEISKLVSAGIQRQENERVMKEVRKHYKETYTVTQTPYGTSVSVSYTRK